MDSLFDVKRNKFRTDQKPRTDQAVFGLDNVSTKYTDANPVRPMYNMYTLLISKF